MTLQLIVAASTIVGAMMSGQVPDSSRELQAQAADRAWLTLVDAGNYGKSWDDASALFQGAVTKAQWESAVGGVRGPLGAVESRKQESSSYRTSLPGAPDGHYVVTVFRTSFAHKTDARETVTAMQAADGSWHVSGYFVR